MKIDPASTSSRPASIRNAVVLPEPDGPTRTMNSPSAMSRSSESTAGASVPGYTLVAWTNRTSANARHSFQLGERDAKLAAEPGLRVGACADLVETQERCADDRRGCGGPNRDVGGDLVQRRVDRGEEGAGGILKDSSAQKDLHGLVEQIQAGQSDPGERDHLRGETLDDLRRDGVVRGFGEDDGRELDHTALFDPAGVDGFGQLARGRETEVGRHHALQGGTWAAAVFATCAGRNGGEAEVVPPTPVAGDRAERGEAGVPTVGRHADAVDSGSARDCDAPAALRPRSQDGERVVADVDPLRPAALLDRLAHDVFLHGEIDSGHQERCDLCNASGVIAEPRLAYRLRQQVLENRNSSVDAEMVRRAKWAAGERQHGPVRLHEGEGGLLVAAVHSEDSRAANARVSAWNCGRCSEPASSRRSTRSSDSGCWPISGCVSKALRAMAGSPVTAASAARRSYAVTCCIRPSSSGATAACGSGVAPCAPTVDSTSMTSSSARPSIVPLFRTSTTCASPLSVASAPTSPMAASL